jgi:hypothetical protein
MDFGNINLDSYLLLGIFVGVVFCANILNRINKHFINAYAENFRRNEMHGLDTKRRW